MRLGQLFRGSAHQIDQLLRISLMLALVLGYGPCMWAKHCLYYSSSASTDRKHRDFADEYPSAEVIGSDLSPIQPHFVPPNLKFEVDDVEEPWLHPENHFDLVHVRALYGAVADWPKFYGNAFRQAYYYDLDGTL